MLKEDSTFAPSHIWAMTGRNSRTPLECRPRQLSGLGRPWLQPSPRPTSFRSNKGWWHNARSSSLTSCSEVFVFFLPVARPDFYRRSGGLGRPSRGKTFGKSFLLIQMRLTSTEPCQGFAFMIILMVETHREKKPRRLQPRSNGLAGQRTRNGSDDSLWQKFCPASTFVQIRSTN